MSLSSVKTIVLPVLKMLVFEEIKGFWYPYKNIFSLVDELEIKPFTNWTKSAQYSEEGLEIEFPIFQDLPQLPTPLGTLLYTQFCQLPLQERLTSLPLIAAAIDGESMTRVSYREGAFQAVWLL